MTEALVSRKPVFFSTRSKTLLNVRLLDPVSRPSSYRISLPPEYRATPIDSAVICVSHSSFKASVSLEPDGGVASLHDPIMCSFVSRVEFWCRRMAGRLGKPAAGGPDLTRRDE